MSVLRGHDWSIPVSVLLIETGVGGHKDEITAFLKAKGYRRLEDFESPTTLNDVFYLPNTTSPLLSPRPVNAGARTSWPGQHPMMSRGGQAAERELPAAPRESGPLLAAQVAAALAALILACCLCVHKIDRDARAYEADLKRRWQEIK